MRRQCAVIRWLASLPHGGRAPWVCTLLQLGDCINTWRALLRVRRRYRMHVKLEQLVGDVVLLKDLQTMLLRSGRTGPSDLPRLYADYESD